MIMRLEKAGTDARGWSAGPWNTNMAIAVGYANEGIDEPHLHREITEIYLVARGEAEIRVEKDSFALEAGDVLVIEPGEAHTFLASTPDYFHFVVHSPCLAQSDKAQTSRARLGLAAD